MTSQLRDLAARIEDVARQHPAYSQAWQPVRTLVDHLSALAGMEEASQKELISERRATLLRECREIMKGNREYDGIINWVNSVL